MSKRRTIPDKISVARLRAGDRCPYFNSLLMSLVPVERPAVGTMAVDRYGRLYYNPAFLDATTDDDMVPAMLHEVLHIYLRHHDRLIDALDTPFLAKCAELGKECAVNTIVEQTGFCVPKEWITPKRFELPPGLATEEYYDALQAKLVPPPSPAQQGGSQGHQNGDDDDDSELDAGGSGGDGEGDASTPQGGDDSRDAGSGSRSGDPGIGRPGSPEDGPGDGGRGGDGDQPGAGEPTRQGVGGRGESNQDDGEDGDGDCSAHGDGPSDRARGTGGSSHDGRQRPWEDPPPAGKGSTPGYEHGELEVLVEHVSAQIEEWEGSHGQGSLPGGLAREARQILHPTVDPVKQLSSMLRHAMSSTYGFGEFTYRRPSRRQPSGGAVLPCHRQPVPSLLVIADTSGSMGDRDLSLALGVVDRVVRKLPDPRGVEVWTGDTQLATCQKVFRPEQVKMAGGGGTDMDALICEASERKNPPEIILVATDGHTGWPGKPTGPKVLACLTRKRTEASVPDWIERVVLRPEDDG